MDVKVNRLMTRPHCAKIMSILCAGNEILVENVPRELLSMEDLSYVFYLDLTRLIFQSDLVKHLWISKYQESYRKAVSEKAETKDS